MTSATRPCDAWIGNSPCGAVPAQLYPAGWRCPAHTPAALAGQPEPPSQPVTRVILETGPAAPCRYCGDTAYRRDGDGPAHACCHAWRAVIQAGYQCPACAAGRWLANPRTRWRPMPPLSRFLPDGRPFAPSTSDQSEAGTYAPLIPIRGWRAAQAARAHREAS